MINQEPMPVHDTCETVRIRRDKSQGLTHDLVQKLDIANERTMVQAKTSTVLSNVEMFMSSLSANDAHPSNMQNNMTKSSNGIKCSSSIALPYRPPDASLHNTKIRRGSNAGLSSNNKMKFTHSSGACSVTSGSGPKPLPRPFNDEGKPIVRKLSHSQLSVRGIGEAVAVARVKEDAARSNSSGLLSTPRDGAANFIPVNRTASAGDKAGLSYTPGKNIRPCRSGPSTKKHGPAVTIGRVAGQHRFQSPSQPLQKFHQLPAAHKRTIARQTSHSVRNSPTDSRNDDHNPCRGQKLKSSSYGADLNGMQAVMVAARAIEEVGNQTPSENDGNFLDSLVQCINLDDVGCNTPTIHDSNTPIGNNFQGGSFSYDNIRMAAKDTVPPTQFAQVQLPVMEKVEPPVCSGLKSALKSSSVTSWAPCAYSSATTGSDDQKIVLEEVVYEGSDVKIQKLDQAPLNFGRGTKYKTSVRYAKNMSGEKEKFEPSMSMIDFLESCEPPEYDCKATKTKKKFSLTKSKEVKIGK